MSTFGFRAEPIAIAAAIRAVLLAAMAFGLDWTAEQLAAVMLAVELVLALFLRTQVVSERTARRAGTSLEEVTRVARSPYGTMRADRWPPT